MYALILYVFAQSGNCLGCSPILMDVNSIPGFTSYAACEQAGEEASKGYKDKYFKYRCVQQG